MLWRYWRGRHGTRSWHARARNGLTIQLQFEPCGFRDPSPWSWSMIDLRRAGSGTLYGEGHFFATARKARLDALTALDRMKPVRPRPVSLEKLFASRPWHCAPRRRYRKGKPGGWLFSDL